jgi:dihydropyrimidinase
MSAEPTFDCVIRGAEVANVSSVETADIGIVGDRIVSVAPDLPGTAAVEIDATGKVAIPGGIDPHTHFDTSSPDGSLVSADDYDSGTRAAAAGGVTTVLNYAFQIAGESLHETMRREAAKAVGRAHVDYGFHPILTDLRDGRTLAEIAEMVRAGYPSVKIFTAYDPFRVTDREAIRVLAAARDAGALVNVHAEDDGLTEYLTETLAEEPPPDLTQLGLFCRSRPDDAEALAIQRVGVYAKFVSCPVYFVHLSSRAAVEAVRRARSVGAQVYTEVRPAYLFLDESRYEQPDGNTYVCIPPLRTTDDQDALWDALAAGEIQTSASDHTTYTAAEKLGPYGRFTEIPPGFASVQTGLGLLYAHGVATGRLTLPQFVGITSANSAKLFGLWPRKGRIAPGADADVVLIDPAREMTLTQDIMQSRSDHDPFTGITVAGWPETTISAGEIVYTGGRVVSRPGRGRWLFRDLSGNAPGDPNAPRFPGGRS